MSPAPATFRLLSRDKTQVDVDKCDFFRSFADGIMLDIVGLSGVDSSLPIAISLSHFPHTVDKILLMKIKILGAIIDIRQMSGVDVRFLILEDRDSPLTSSNREVITSIAKLLISDFVPQLW
jgi:hypothetical protein